MPSLEVLNSTLQELKDSGIHTFKTKHWFEDLVSGKLTKQAPQGAFVERTLVVGSPARGRMILRGDESLSHTRYRIVRKIRLDPFRWAVSPVIPIKDVRENVGPGAALDLVTRYAMVPIEAYYNDLNKARMTGVPGGLSSGTAEFRGATVLNGQYATGVVAGTENGLFDFATFAAQNELVQSLTKDSSIFYANQWRNIASWATNGMRTMEIAWRDAAHYAQGANKGPDVILMDPVTYSNYRESARQQVRVVVNDARDEKKDSLLQLDLGDGALVCCEYDIDTTQFTSAAPAHPENGVTYMINTDGWEYIEYEALDLPPLEKQKETQEGFYTHGADHHILLCKNLAAQACVSGGN